MIQASRSRRFMAVCRSSKKLARSASVSQEQKLRAVGGRLEEETCATDMDLLFRRSVIVLDIRQLSGRRHRVFPVPDISAYPGSRKLGYPIKSSRLLEQVCCARHNRQIFGAG